MLFDDDAQRLQLSNKPTLKMILNEEEKGKFQNYFVHRKHWWNETENIHINRQLQFSYLDEQIYRIHSLTMFAIAKSEKRKRKRAREVSRSKKWAPTKTRIFCIKQTNRKTQQMHTQQKYRSCIKYLNS